VGGGGVGGGVEDIKQYSLGNKYLHWLGLMVGDHDPRRRAVWIRDQVPLDLDFLIWLQCKWFGCNPGETLSL
jgi:hypothetical protein